MLLKEDRGLFEMTAVRTSAVLVLGGVCEEVLVRLTGLGALCERRVLLEAVFPTFFLDWLLLDGGILDGGILDELVLVGLILDGLTLDGAILAVLILDWLALVRLILDWLVFDELCLVLDGMILDGLTLDGLVLVGLTLDGLILAELVLFELVLDGIIHCFLGFVSVPALGEPRAGRCGDWAGVPALGLLWDGRWGRVGALVLVDAVPLMLVFCGSARDCCCRARCVSLNSRRDKKRTLRTSRSSPHGIPSLMS